MSDENGSTPDTIPGYPLISIRQGAMLYMKGWIDGYVAAEGEDAVGTPEMSSAADAAYEQFKREARG